MYTKKRIRVTLSSFVLNLSSMFNVESRLKIFGSLIMCSKDESSKLPYHLNIP